MPRKQRFAPKKPRAPKLADGTVPLTPVQRAPTTLITALPLAPQPAAEDTAASAPPPAPVRGRDAVIDD